MKQYINIQWVIIIVLAIIVLPKGLVAQDRATIPYSQDFDTPDSYGEFEFWQNGSSLWSGYGTDYHIHSEMTPFVNLKSCTLNDDEGDGEAWASLDMDLSNTDNVFLDFEEHRYFNYYEYSPCEACVLHYYYDDTYSGVFISDGTNSARIYQFVNAGNVHLDLSDLAAQNNIQLNDQFSITFKIHTQIAIDPNCHFAVTLDNLEVYRECEDYYSLLNNTTPHLSPNSDGYYLTSNYVSAENVTVQSSTSVTFDASNYVHLKTGFHAENNSDFHALLDGCEAPNKSAKFNIEEDFTSKNIRVNIYPNPNNGNFKVDFSGNDEPVNIEVINILGSTVLRKTVTQTSNFDISNQEDGIYYVKTTIGEEVFIEKIIKQ